MEENMGLEGSCHHLTVGLASRQLASADAVQARGMDL